MCGSGHFHVADVKIRSYSSTCYEDLLYYCSRTSKYFPKEVSYFSSYAYCCPSGISNDELASRVERSSPVSYLRARREALLNKQYKPGVQA